MNEEWNPSQSKTLIAGNSSSCFEILDNLPRHATFYPLRFMEQGAGKKYLDNLRSEEKLKEPPDSLVPRIIQFVPLSGRHCMPIYYHVHKTGGTSLQQVQLKKWLNDVYYFRREMEMGSENFLYRTKAIVKDSYESPALNPGFAFIRDPVLRFPSSVAQVLKGRPHTVDHCLESPDTHRLLYCILTMIERHGHFPETHLLPQAYELYGFVQGYDAMIHLTDMSAISPILRDLGAPRFFGPRMTRVPHPKFPKFHDLVNVTIPDFLVQKICKIYQVDVLMIKETKVTTTMCP